MILTRYLIYYGSLIDKERKEYKLKFLSKLNEILKLNWNVVKRIINPNNSTPIILKDDNNNYLNNDELSIYTKTFFQNKFNDRNFEFEINNINNINFDDDIIINCIKCQGKHKSPDINKITAEMYQKVDEESLKFIVRNIKFLLIENPYDYWKKSEIVLIAKNRNPSTLSEYRPITICKIIYKIIMSIWKDWFIENGYISSSYQFGFSRNKCTTDCIFILKRCVEEANKLNKPLYIASVDIQAAYDNVKWCKLFDILSLKFGTEISSNILKWYNGTTCVRINGKLSEEFLPRKGVKQGCPLAPILFNMVLDPILNFIGDLPGYNLYNKVNISAIAYADDIMLYDCNLQHLEFKLNILKNYLIDIGLNLSPNKTFITSNEYINNSNYKFIRGYEYFKYLGVF